MEPTARERVIFSLCLFAAAHFNRWRASRFRLLNPPNNPPACFANRMPVASGVGGWTWGVIRFGLRREEFHTRPHFVEANEADHPIQIGAFGVDGVVVEAEERTDFIKQFWALTFCGQVLFLL